MYFLSVIKKYGKKDISEINDSSEMKGHVKESKMSHDAMAENPHHFWIGE